MFRLPILYPITDQSRSGLRHSEQVRLLAAGGARLIQLRDKDSSPKEFALEGARAMAVALELRVQIIVNDRVDIALAISAHGVHLGQDDMPPDAARRLLGDQAIIGFSSHNLQQAVEAVSKPVDYIAVGPIFATSSKADGAPVVGLKGLSTVRKAVGDKTLVAIGGIDLSNASQALSAGAYSLAVISALYGVPHEISDRVKDFFALYQAR